MSQEIIAQCGLLVTQGKYAQAERMCQDLLKDDPRCAEAHGVLGTIKYLTKEHEAARRHMSQALELKPDYLDARNVLGLILLEHDRKPENAARVFEEIVERDPDYLNAWVNLGNVSYNTSRHVEAKRCYEHVLALNPNNFYALNNLGSIDATAGRYDAAIELFKRAYALKSSDQELLGNLMNFLMVAKRWPEAYELLPKLMKAHDYEFAAFVSYNFVTLACLWDYEKLLLPRVLALIARGDAPINAFNNVNLSLLANPALSNERVFEVHKAAGQAMRALRTREPYDDFPAAFSNRGKMRIGYLSPDFRAHSVSNFLRGIINAHDRDRFEIYLYSSVAPDSADETTLQYAAAADCFVDANPLSDAELAQRIHQDGVHVLVDLAGFTYRSRMMVMAYRPAPVQMSYIGYPYTSGMKEVDYFLSSAYLDGPKNKRFFVETQLHLPDSPFTFDSLNVQPIDAAPPFERNGFITFGTLNNPYKFSPKLIGVWCRILQRLPDSRLIINHPNCRFEQMRARLVEAVAQCGVDAARVSFIWEKHPKVSHLYYYNDIDISLDTFPLTGGTTTVDAIWMGVPVVSLAGDAYYQRLSYSFLMNTGVDVSDLCAFSEPEYVDKAVALAGNRARIRELRAALPQTLKRSVLRDSIQLTRNLETAFVEGCRLKYPSRKIVFEDAPRLDAIEWVSLPGAVEAAAVESMRDQESYIVREHRGWYDAEYHFFLDLVGAGARVLDIGSGLGAYALPAARRAGPQGRVWAATLSPRDARLLELGRKRNALANLADLTRGQRKMIIDDDTRDADIRAVDLVRINPAISGPHLLECAHEFFTRETPIVMFGSARAEGYAKQGAVEPFFRGLGYGIFRWVPGIAALIPLGPDETLDMMTINVFACRPAQAAALAAHGKLATELAPLTQLPGMDDESWRTFLAQFPYSAAIAPSARAGGEDYADIYRLSLTLYAQAQQAARSVAERHACLVAACGTLRSVLEAAPSFARHLSLIRILADLGATEEAVTRLQEIIRHLESGAPIALDEPFLAPSEFHARLDPGERVAEWLVAALLDTFEALRAFSTWFTGADSLERLDIVCSSGFASEASMRRRNLLHTRIEAQAATR